MMLQIQRAIDSHAPARRRSMDLYTLRKHVVQIVNSMKDAIKNSPGLSKQEGHSRRKLFVRRVFVDEEAVRTLEN